MKTKILSLFCLTIVLFAAGCSSLAQAAAPEKNSGDPGKVVENFYADYLGYIGNPASDEFRNPMVDRIYRDRIDLTSEFITQIDELLDSFDGAGYDPFLCAQDIPTSMTVEEVNIDEGSAAVKVVSSFIQHKLDVDLVQIDGEWKINNIRCGF